LRNPENPPLESLIQNHPTQTTKIHATIHTKDKPKSICKPYSINGTKRFKMEQNISKRNKMFQSGTKCFKMEQNVSKRNKMFQNGTLGTSETLATLATSSVPASAFLSVWATEDGWRAVD
jgi:hypothetical protein